MLRLVSSRIARGLPALAFIAAASTASAQERVLAPGATGFGVIHGGELPISDSAVADIVARNFPDALHGEQAYHITIVVDANGKYVSGKATKATIISRSSADADGFVLTDSATAVKVAAAKMAAREYLGGGAMPAGAVIISRSSGAEGSTALFAGTEFMHSDISTMGMKRYAPGALGDAMIMVTVAQLKP